VITNLQKRISQKDIELAQLSDAQVTINEQRRVADECIALKNKEIAALDGREKSLLENFQKL
jgi:hypothetical protein